MFAAPNLEHLLVGLNPEQRAAVTLPAESALILAGAGSGKTRVLTTRISWLFTTGQISPLGVLAVTFTNKAAKEMLTRLTAQIPVNPRGMWVGTFHGLCNRLLRLHFRDAGLPQSFQILDMQDQLSVVKRVIKVIGADDERYPPRQVQNFINTQKEAGLRAVQCASHDAPSRMMVDLYTEYENTCVREGVVDFAELLLRSVELLRANAMLREHYQARFLHILVDEFQDTNRLQYDWLRLLAGPHTAMFVVGDDDQSIYGFRGARVSNMVDFEKDFRAPHLIKLEQNYRSTAHILSAANALIEQNPERLGKTLWTAAGEGEQVRVFEAFTDGDEARFVMDEMRALHRSGTDHRHMAILYRSNAQSRVFEHQLVALGMPYRVYGGLRFFERQEIKHALAYLRLTINRDDDNGWLRVVNFPPRGIGARTLEGVQATARATGSSLWQASCRHTPSGRAGAAIGGFVNMIEAVSDEIANLPLTEKLDVLLDRCGLRAHYQNEGKESEERLANLDELINAAASFMIENDGGTVEDFIGHAALEAGDAQAEVGEDAVQLMTVHASKGLEFENVFVVGLEEGLFPHENSFSSEGGLEEERRLMYVAITRARTRLYLSSAQQRMMHGQTRYAMPSRFFKDIPDAHLNWLNRRVANPFGMNEGGLGASTAPANITQTPLRPTLQTPVALPRGLRIGLSVKHPKFGVGVITHASGHGEDARVRVNFSQHGSKELLVSFAPLEPV